MAKHYQVVIEQDEDGIYIGTVLGLPSCYTEGKTMDRLLDKLADVVPLCERQLECKQKKAEHLANRFIGVRDLVLQRA